MDTPIIVVAQYAIGLVALGGLIVWLRASRPDKVALAVEVIIAVLAALVLIKVTGALHNDPRPFVQDPTLQPLFPHGPDNGFPSDHTALTSAIAFVVMAHRRAWGVGLLVVSVLIGAARVAAHVHHWQDIGAGLVVGLVAALIGILVWRAICAWRERRSPAVGSGDLSDPQLPRS